MAVQAFAVTEKGGRLEPFTFEEVPLGPLDVEVAVGACGICHTDVHLIDDDFGFSKYPMVPGHEVVGVVSKIGAEVKGVTEGQRVGIGWLAGSCRTCRECVAGDDNVCSSVVGTAVGRWGGLAEKIVVDSRYAFPLPEALATESAGPLMCAGATVYGPYVRLGIRGAHRVGVVGIGGLGHLALQFGAALGCEMTAISHSPGKKEEAKRLGANHFLTYDELGSAAGTFDFLLFTVSANVNWPHLISALAPNGTLCLLGLPNEPIPIRPTDLVHGQRSVTGGAVANRATTAEMLAFAARHEIVPQTEVFPASQINEAIDKVREGKVRYRAVIAF